MATTTKPAARKPAAKKAVATKPASGAGATSKAAVAAAMKEFALIQRKAKLVGSKALDTHFDSDGNPQGAWAEVIAELDAWAKKHKVKLSTREHVTGGGDPGAPTPRVRSECPRTMSTTERFNWPGGGYTDVRTTCTLRRRAVLTGRCVYSCASEVTGAVGGHL
ncbi:MAG: hypothetical protein KDK07_26350 [Bauldia sp.]|nr:hypothetical protein [Bauldia sp.]